MLNPNSISKICLILLCHLFVAEICVGKTSDDVEIMLQQIENSKGTEKVDAIIDFVKAHYHFNTASSIAYGEVGLGLLASNATDKQSSELHSQLAKAYLANGDIPRADELIKIALSIAQRSNNAQQLLLAQLVSAGIELKKKKYSGSANIDTGCDYFSNRNKPRTSPCKCLSDLWHAKC